jgi:RAQPRD family integrative conjugative element protein
MKLTHSFALIIGMSCSFLTHADTDTTTEDERRYLIKIAQELAAIDVLAEKAAGRADHNARVVFDYASLRHDLKEIHRAVEAHLAAPSRSPRKMNSLELTQ